MLNYNLLTNGTTRNSLLGGVTNSPFSRNLIDSFSGMGNLYGGGTNKMDLGFGNSNMSQQPTEAEQLGGMLAGGVTSALNGALRFNDINNSGMNSLQKKMSRTDATVDTISSLASNIPGIGGMIGGSLGALNKIGGMFVKTPTAVKNYVANDQVAASSAFGGVTSQMGDVANSIDTFKGSGLLGKLRGKNRLKGDVAKTNYLQTAASDILTDNQFAKDRATSSSDLFATNNTNKLYGGNMFKSTLYGQQGMKIGRLRNPNTNPTSQEKYKQNAVGKDVTDPFDAVLSAPQKSMVWGIGQGYKTPAEALNIKDRYTKAGTDLVLDPLNALMFLKAAKLAKVSQSLEGITNLSKGANVLNDVKKLVKTNNTLKTVKAISKAQDAESLYSSLMMHKRGGTIDFKKVIRSAKKPVKVEEVTKDIETFKSGGNINVIVDGKLHAHKHDLKDKEEFKDAEITHKGVAVVSLSEGGDLTQCAEVERDELILHIGLTKKMESLAKEGDEDAMIQAGRILARELVKNTRDSSNKILKTA